MPLSGDLDEYSCVECGKWLQSPVVVALHRIRAHGFTGTAARARECVGSVCLVCGGEFLARLRLLRHLAHGAAACVGAVLNVQLLSLAPDEVAAANESDRDIAGPPCRPPPVAPG